MKTKKGGPLTKYGAAPQEDKLVNALKEFTTKSGATKMAYNKSSDGMTLYVGNSEEEAQRAFSELQSTKRKNLHNLIELFGDQLTKIFKGIFHRI